MRMRIAQRRDNGAELDSRVSEVVDFFHHNLSVAERDLAIVLGTLGRTL